MKKTITLGMLAFLASGLLAAARPAYEMTFDNRWELTDGLPEKAMLISLQGIVNKDGPELYFIYPEQWSWKITPAMRDFFSERHGFDFTTLHSPEEALQHLGGQAKGYVVWDKAVRTSIIVAFTIAGLEDAILVNEDLIPMAEAAGLTMIEDLRGDFRGMTDAEIYEIAYERYWDRTSRDIIIWMGGAAGKRMEPGVADYGIYRGAFFCDLSANPKHPEELALHRKLLKLQHPQSVVMGWHSYAKDTEGQHVSLVSSNGLKMEGLNSLPNISFHTQVPFTEDFKFRNHHNVGRNERVIPKEKVYISLIQTDSIGIGAWTKPGRGRIPYAWQVSMNWTWIAPCSIQYFAEAATPNDYFIGGLSGPGYMYPKPIPEEAFWPLMKEANRLMDILDLRVMEIMDYSEGNRHVGNTDLTEDVVDRYYKAFPDVIGFINGYGSARTFDLRDSRPMVSYDYYLGLNRPEDEAVADFRELMELNPERPYFLLVHVRESTNIDRVADILEQLGDEAEVVPLDVFLKMAAEQPTFTRRYLQPGDPKNYNP